MSNLLSLEKSPYLLQHKDNPIAWMPWGEAAFAKAKAEDLPVFLSVGYSTCHWCHVMAHETFEDQSVADVLNGRFVAVKVDREERPDVDALYMRALQALTGGGGWPMSVWLTPEGSPFFAGTYYPKHRFIQILNRIDEIWRQDRGTLRADAGQLLSLVGSLSVETASSAFEEDKARQFLRSYINHFQDLYDDRHGGFGSAPKFPQTMNLMLMMRQDYQTGLGQAETMVTGTLGQMARGGIYDQLRGGFHRYSVDERWLVPHFEKMLYDQALLSVTLAEAHLLYNQLELARVARETLDYVLHELTDPAGGFYSAQDADSLNPEDGHVEEGFFATFGGAELASALTVGELDALRRVYGVSRVGQFEGRNILHLQPGFDGTNKAEPEVRSALAKLEQIRKDRPQPHLDDKVIAAWNGWMIWALAKAAAHLSEPRYLEAARRALSFARQNLFDPQTGLLFRYWRQGQACGQGMAEDYASLILALIEVSQSDPDPQHAEWALSLQATLDEDFWDKQDGGYFTGQVDPKLPLRTKDDYDGVHPCANSMAAFNLECLYLLTGEVRYREQSDRIFNNLFSHLKTSPSSLPFLGLALDWRLANGRVAIGCKEDWTGALQVDLRSQFLPHLLVMDVDAGWPIGQGKKRGQFHICESGQCLPSANSKDEALNLLGIS